MVALLTASPRRIPERRRSYSIEPTGIVTEFT
jgi:hypothetical protein